MEIKSTTGRPGLETCGMAEKIFEAIGILMELGEKELAFQLRVISDHKLRDWNQCR